MATTVDMPTFAGGEVGRAVQARYDVAKYRTALDMARNVTGMVGGGQAIRPGLEFVGQVPNHARKNRLIPFQFSLSDSYALVFGHQTMRVATSGGFVTEAELQVTAATNSNPLTVTVPGNPYAIGDEVYFSDIEGMVELNGLTLKVTAAGGGVLTFGGVNSTAWGVFTGAGGGVPGGEDPTPPPVTPDPDPPAPDPDPSEPPPFVPDPPTPPPVVEGPGRFDPILPPGGVVPNEA